MLEFKTPQGIRIAVDASLVTFVKPGPGQAAAPVCDLYFLSVHGPVAVAGTFDEVVAKITAAKLEAR